MNVSFEPVAMEAVPWEKLDARPDRTIFQTREWLNFVAETQGAEPVMLEMRSDGSSIGWFTGLIVRKFGMRVLGSPFPGWTTSYQAFNLNADVPRKDLVRPLADYAFKRLHCIHLEMMDRAVGVQDAIELGLAHRAYRTLVIDLTQSEEVLLSKMKNTSCRQCIRKAAKNGVQFVEAQDTEAFIKEYYEQLKDVFIKQKLVPTYAPGRVRALVRHISPTGRLLLVRGLSPDGTCIATGIYLGFNKTMYFWGGASWRQHQHWRPNEALMWHAMRYWKARGMTTFDMMGYGKYKVKYGGSIVELPWMRASRWGVLETARNFAKSAIRYKQRFLGRMRDKEVAKPAEGEETQAAEQSDTGN